MRWVYDNLSRLPYGAFEVGGCLHDDFGVVLKQSDSCIAGVAQSASESTRAMVVIPAQILGRAAYLARVKQCRPALRKKSLPPLAVSCSPSWLACVGRLLQVDLRPGAASGTDGRHGAGIDLAEEMLANYSRKVATGFLSSSKSLIAGLT